MEPGNKIIKPPAFTPTEARAASGARRFVRLEEPFRMHRGGSVAARGHRLRDLG